MYVKKRDVSGLGLSSMGMVTHLPNGGSEHTELLV